MFVYIIHQDCLFLLHDLIVYSPDGVRWGNDRSLGAVVKVLRKKGKDSGLNMFLPYLGVRKSKRGPWFPLTLLG